MKKFFEEFKAFAMRGNVLDMAIGVVIGGAFGKNLSSFSHLFVPLFLCYCIGTPCFFSLFFYSELVRLIIKFRIVFYKILEDIFSDWFYFPAEFAPHLF